VREQGLLSRGAERRAQGECATAVEGRGGGVWFSVRTEPPLLMVSV
jgi:hypothetical protein